VTLPQNAISPTHPATPAWPPPKLRLLCPRTVQAAAIAWTHEQQRGTVICLVSARSGGWTLPKGHVDPGNLPHESAAIEAYEEAGVIGEVLQPAIGFYDYTKSSGKRCRVIVFPLRVTTILDRWHEEYSRERIWIEPAEIEHWLEMPEPIRIVNEFSEHLPTNSTTPPPDPPPDPPPAPQPDPQPE